MKLLPCPNCPDRRAKVGPGREPYYARSFPGPRGRPAQFRCSGCGRLVRLTAQEFNALPTATPAALEEAGALDGGIRDLTLGGTVPKDQARDLALAGVSVDELAALDAGRMAVADLGRVASDLQPVTPAKKRPAPKKKAAKKAAPKKRAK